MVAFYLVLCSARWIGIHGFSIGIDDVQPGETLTKERKKLIEQGYNDCDEKIKAFALGSLHLKAGLDAAKSLEAELTTILNKIREATGKVNT